LSRWRQFVKIEVETCKRTNEICTAAPQNRMQCI
jgi:hypothetical protein